MADEIRPEVIKKTQSSLGRYIKKPPLTEKLLRKPPFRFLHDIVSAVIKETGFLENLFSDEELNADIRDKEAKIAYLTKLINVVKLVTGIELTVRPTKIIAGQEPTKTNELLQAIGKALDKNINSAEVIQHYKANLEKASQKVSQSKSAKQEHLKTKATKRNDQAREVPRQYDNVAEPSKPPTQHERKSKKEMANQQDTMKTNDPGKMHQLKKPKVNEETTRNLKGSAHPSKSKIQIQKSSTVSAKLLSETQNEGGQITHPPPSPLSTEEQTPLSVGQNISTDGSFTDTPSVVIADNKVPDISEESHRTLDGTAPLLEEAQPKESADGMNQPSISDESVLTSKDSVRPLNGRPSSARPAAPKLRWKPDFSINKSNELTLLKNDAVIVENFDAPDDDTDNMVVLETGANKYSVMNDGFENLYDEGNREHGYLVAQILETQRELAKDTAMDLISNKVDTEMERSSKKYKENITKEVEQLRSTIQTLTRATHPMGKLLDFLQEDVESMQTELFEWRNQYAQLRNQLQVEKADFQATTHPLEEAFNEIQAGINFQLDKIHQTKSNIVKNNYKMHQLLEGRA